jgi:hypothetical protein
MMLRDMVTQCSDELLYAVVVRSMTLLVAECTNNNLPVLSAISCLLVREFLETCNLCLFSSAYYDSRTSSVAQRYNYP